MPFSCDSISRERTLHDTANFMKARKQFKPLGRNQTNMQPAGIISSAKGCRSLARQRSFTQRQVGVHREDVRPIGKVAAPVRELDVIEAGLGQGLPPPGSTEGAGPACRRLRGRVIERIVRNRTEDDSAAEESNRPPRMGNAHTAWWGGRQSIQQRTASTHSLHPSTRAIWARRAESTRQPPYQPATTTTKEAIMDRANSRFSSRRERLTLAHPLHHLPASPPQSGPSAASRQGVHCSPMSPMMVISDMLRECELVAARGWRGEHWPEDNKDAHERENDTQPRHDVGLGTLAASACKRCSESSAGAGGASNILQVRYGNPEYESSIRTESAESRMVIPAVNIVSYSWYRLGTRSQT
ncbi:hypothetical protein B0H13DRAFT_1884613 [Mycena leptocephala]|nr:hypothetical protein B0H13DRAFT_1884613 [Mycena leptocephala]